VLAEYSYTIYCVVVRNQAREFDFTKKAGAICETAQAFMKRGKLSVSRHGGMYRLRHVERCQYSDNVYSGSRIFSSPIPGLMETEYRCSLVS